MFTTTSSPKYDITNYCFHILIDPLIGWICALQLILFWNLISLGQNTKQPVRPSDMWARLGVMTTVNIFVRLNIFSVEQGPDEDMVDNVTDPGTRPDIWTLVVMVDHTRTRITGSGVPRSVYLSVSQSVYKQSSFYQDTCSNSDCYHILNHFLSIITKLLHFMLFLIFLHLTDSLDHII